MVVRRRGRRSPREGSYTVTVETPSGEAVSVLGEFVEPVQLQVVCYSLFERFGRRHRNHQG